MQTAFRVTDRGLVITALAGVTLLAWAYLVPASLDMYGSMDGLSRWMMEATWDGRYLLLMFGMWSVMMVGMMLPSALPTILIYTRALSRDDRQSRRRVLRTYSFAAGYLAAWTGFSAAATLLQWRLAEGALVSPMMVSASQWLGGALLLVAGIYQWTPLKSRCLAGCRSPLAVLVESFRPGMTGAFRTGLRHGLTCVGCCWALMLLLFVGGVMNLLWIVAISAFVLLEKLAPYGVQGGKLSGIALGIAGVWVLTESWYS
jgi:predicted metal-binding membrane protein